MSQFEQYLAREIPTINRFLEGVTNALNPLVQPPVRHVLLAGGKRLRPLLTILTARAMGFVPDVDKVVTSDSKAPGDLVYLLGMTRAELGASELADELGFTSPDVPQVDAAPARQRYVTLHAAMMPFASAKLLASVAAMVVPLA